MDGVTSLPVLLTGSAAGVAGVGWGLKKLDSDDIPATAILTAGFFAASLIRFPVGVSSVHLVFGSLLGLILGWRAFPAVFVGLLMQMVMLQFGGWTTLLLNTFNIAAPGVGCYLVLRRFVYGRSAKAAQIAAAFAGFVAVVFSASLVALELVISNPALAVNAGLEIVAHVPVALAEMVVCALTVGLLRRMRPEMFKLEAEPD